MDSSTNNLLQWLENTSLADFISQSLWIYPSLEIVHIIGIVMLVGPAFMFDLLLLGLAKKLPIKELGNHLLDWSQRGLWLIVPSGMLLFITNAEALAYDPVFITKMSLLLLGGVNALFFHRFALKSHITWNKNVPTPPKAKIIACVSILIWISVIACGQLLAY